MPPKRKTVSASTDDSPTKRRTRSSGAVLPDPPLSRASSTPKKLIKTYGRCTPRTPLITTSLTDSRKDRGVCGGSPEESSEDELNLSPSKSHKRLANLPYRKTSSSILEVTILSRRRPANDDAANSTASPAVKRNLPLVKTCHTPRTHAKSCVPNAETRLSPSSSSKIPALRTNGYVSRSEQDVYSDGGPSPSPMKPLPSINVSSPMRNLRKRPQDSDDELALHPSPKRLKLDANSHASEPSSTTWQAFPALTTDDPRSPSPKPTRSTSTPPSPPDDAITLAASSPSRKRLSKPQTHIPPHLYPCLNAQKRAILRALHNPPKTFCVDEDGESEDDEVATNETAFQQLTDVLTGTVTRGEGNSCLLLGPRGSGKTSLVEKCISNLSPKPHILRLSGCTQISDRLAMREIAYQLGQQTGHLFLSQKNDAPERDTDDVDEHNPFLDASPNSTLTPSNVSLPPSSQLPGLISLLPTLSQSTIVILDGFDLFALHPRQSLLYCLLDTVQSCRAGAQSKGLAVIGTTSRMDTINILEKRVKSRFSGRMIRTSPPGRPRHWVEFAKAVLLADTEHVPNGSDQNAFEEWRSLWEVAVHNFLTDKATLNILDETFSITRDIRMLSRLLISFTVHLSPLSPSLMTSQFASAAVLQRSRPRFPFLHALSYPSLCLLVACIHADTAGHSIFTFEMLHEYFRDQVRASMSAPVQVNGGSIGMVRCSREVLMTAFEHLINIQTFLCVTPLSPNIAKEFLKYRCLVDKTEIKKAIETTGQINLKKWLTKAQ